MKAVIDRFEEAMAVLTPSGGGKPFNLPKSALPPDAASGTTVELIKNNWVIQQDETDERRKRIADKGRRMFRE